MSSIIEKQTLIASGSQEKSTIEKLFAFTRIEITDVLGAPGAILQAMGETIDAIWTILRSDYSFTRSTPENPNLLGTIWQYFMWAVGIGVLISFAMIVSQVVRGK